MVEQHAPKPPRTRTWVKVLLAVSLALNLAVLGLVAGAGLRAEKTWHTGSPDHARNVVRDLGLAPIIGAFPPEMRREMAREFRDRSGPPRADRLALAAELEDALGVLRSEPFDRAALEGLLNRQRDRVAARLSAGRDVVLDRIEAMSAQERVAFADKLEKSLARALQEAQAARQAPREP